MFSVNFHIFIDYAELRNMQQEFPHNLISLSVGSKEGFVTIKT